MQHPRLRDKNGREVAVPAYDRLRDDANIGARVRDILVAGVLLRLPTQAASALRDLLLNRIVKIA